MRAIAKVTGLIITKHYQNIPSKSVRRILPGAPHIGRAMLMLARYPSTIA
jgi:hypothetical protein